MEEILLDILEELRVRPGVQRLSDKRTQAIVRAHNAGLDAENHFAKKQLLPYYLRVKSESAEKWREWQIDDALEKRLLSTLQVKPRRTASGVATISVITKPHACNSACFYCPNDIRMPKSYLHKEPACQRAERSYFDPYLQVVARARALHEMGHNIEKIELIVLGGTWCDYPLSYQIWFAKELFFACNEIERELEGASGKADERKIFYEDCGVLKDNDALEAQTRKLQEKVNAGIITYNDAVNQLYGESGAWAQVSATQSAALDELIAEQQKNETAKNRVVGFVVETRPSTINAQKLSVLRALGCTKVQMGIQSMNEQVLSACNRSTTVPDVERALSLARLFGFKLHTHFMLNLIGATPQDDKQDYLNFINNPATTPDEVKLYPCALVEGTKLCDFYKGGDWRPYTEDELIDVLSFDVMNTPPYCRISRMIRDISSCDILVGNKKTNLRQMVDNYLEKGRGEKEDRALEGGTKKGFSQESGLQKCAAQVQEIRQREISTLDINLDSLEIDDVTYETSVSTEHFLQWVTPDNHIAGFLRLSLPKREALTKINAELQSCATQTYATHKQNAPTEESTAHSPEQITHAAEARCAQSCAKALAPNCAMIREVHIYGRAANIGASVQGAQHTGLGRALILRAQDIAKSAGYERINVISSVGTREYYEHLGFHTMGAYQQKLL